MKKRILSMLLVIVMVLSVLPVQALADGEALKIEPEICNVIAGDPAVQLSAKKGGVSVDAENLTWATDPGESDIATVSNDGKLAGSKQGEIKVVAVDATTGDVGTKTYKVYQPPVELKLVKAGTTEEPAGTMKVGESVQLGYTCSNLSEILPEYIITGWSIRKADNVNVVSTDGFLEVDSTGKLTAKKVGTATVRLAMNGRSVTKTIEVLPADPGVITVTEPNELHNVYVDKSLTLTTTIGVNSADAAFTVDKEGIVDITKSGNVFTVTGKAPGEVTIHFTMTGSQNKKYEGSYKVIVDALKTMEIRADSDAFYAGKSVQLRAFEGDKELTGVVWWCDTSSVANAARNTGLLTCVGAGPARVKARLDNYNDAWMEITVNPNPLQIQSKAGKKAVTQIDVGNEIELEVVDATGETVAVTTWSSSDPTKATVENGLLKGLKKTDADITITANVNGTNVEQKITVNNKSFTVKNGDEVLSGDSVLPIYVGDTIQLTAVDGKTAYWYSDKTDKATITLNGGELTGVEATAEGETVQIKVDVDGYDRVTFQVKVLPKASFIKLRLDDLDRPVDLAVGETRSLMAFVDTSGNPVEGVKWKVTGGTGKAEVVGENEDQLHGLKDGDVELTATCVGFASETVTIHVTTELLESVEIPGFPKEMNEGQEIVLSEILDSAKFTPAYATDKTINFTSCNKDDSTKNDIVAIVDGKLVAKKFGTAIVTGTYTTKTGPVNLTFEVTVKAAKRIVVDPDMSNELICGETLELKAVLKNAAGETLGDQVQWRLKNDKVIKNLVDLTANELTAYPQSTYDFTVKLEAFIEGNNQVEVVEVPIHVIPRTTNIALKKGDEDISDKTIVLNVNDPSGITIDAVIRPSDAKKIVEWHIDGPANIYKATRSDKSIKIEPVSTQKTGTITVTATAKDGTNISRKTTIVFARMADSVLITNAPAQMRGGANIQLRTNLDEDETITDRRVKWSVPKEFEHFASVTVDGLLDTKMVTERTTISVEATLIANPEKKDVKPIELCPAVKSIKIVMEDGTQPNGKSIVNFADGDIQLDKIAYPAGHIGSKETDQTGVFVWTSSNEKVATVDPATGVVTPVDAGNVRISCTAYDTDFETALKIARGEIRDDTKVMAIGYKSLEIVKAAGYVVIDEVDELVSGKNTILTATVYTDEECTELAANQKVTWSVEDEYGNPTKAATINSRGRLYAKPVNYGTDVIVVAKSVENKDAEPGRISVRIKPKQAKTFMAVMTAEPEEIILGSSLNLNIGVETSIFGKWYISEDDDFELEYDCTYNSSDRNVASIDGEGTLVTKKSGSTVITVRATDEDTRNVYTAKFTLRVANLVGYVHIAEADKSLTMRSGQSMNLTATAWTDSGMATKSDNQGFIWKVYQMDEETGERIIAKAASVSSSGRVYANSVTKNTPVWVEATSVENNDQISSPCPILIRPKNVYTPRVFFEGVDEDGKPKELSGTVTRSITSNPMDIQVRAYASDPSFDYTTDGFDMNPATVFTVTWDSNNRKVIDVVGNQLVYKDTGRATVTAKFTVNRITYSASITINVVRPVTSLTVTSRTSSLDMYAGKSLLMLAKVNSDATNKRVEWSFINEEDYEVASINSTTGLIRAKKGLTTKETVTVIARTTDGSDIPSAPVTVTIHPLATKVEIDEGSYITMVKGDDDTLHATVYPDGEACQKVTWSSSRSSVVSVDKYGNIVAKKRGTATIKAKATDGSGKYATIRITVTNS